MEVLLDEGRCPSPPEGSVVTIGAYDGVHVGHLAVIEQVRELAAEREMATAVVTFDRHPASVVRPESAPLLLTDLDQKLELLAATGVDYTLVIRFDETRSRESAESFVHDDLVGCLHARAVVVGEDFHFGHGRRGNVGLLREMGAQLGFEVVPVALVDAQRRPTDGEKVSSTAIRAALRAGDLAAANRMLGRPHEVRGVVGDGDKRARELGFPTANLAVPDQICLPADGIYAGWYLRHDGRALPAAISLGRRPTFYEAQHYSLLEAHVLDFEGDLYGEQARVQFVAHLRDELRFESAEALVAQMARDCDAARALLVG
ncbi:MAG: bifunctional riboflavin kinase/FAD synthetase [Acidimicrobiales bacterium]|nr:bifunctional riboflavin kinase/FAD synthetase [Acidimicrobiales bacterium]